MRRVVFMSTGSTMCGWEWDDSLPYGRLAAGERDLVDRLEAARLADPAATRQPVRRGQAVREAAARWFSDQTPMSVLVIRLGAVLPSNQPSSSATSRASWPRRTRSR